MPHGVGVHALPLQLLVGQVARRHTRSVGHGRSVGRFAGTGCRAGDRPGVHRAGWAAPVITCAVPRLPRMPLFSFEGRSPQVHPEAWVAPTATLVGDVVVEAGASVWYGVRAAGRFRPHRHPGRRQRAGQLGAARRHRPGDGDRPRCHRRAHVRGPRRGGGRRGADRERLHRAGRRADRPPCADRGGQPGAARRGDPRRGAGAGDAGAGTGAAVGRRGRVGRRQPVDLPGAGATARGRDRRGRPTAHGLHPTTCTST